MITYFFGLINKSKKFIRSKKPSKTEYLMKGTVIAINLAEDILIKNNSTKRTIKGMGISLALLFSFMLLSCLDVSAQYTQDRRQRRIEDRRDRREDRRDDRRDARRDGYQDGLREGAEDARSRRRANPQAESDYRRAGGEDNQRERQAYRTGFLQGYREGYNRYFRSNGNRRGY